MKFLFLTSSPGYGHTRAAEAIDLALRQRYASVETRYLNITHLMDRQVSEAIQEGYLCMTREQPELYQKLYDMDKDFYRQLAGKIPADPRLVSFLEKQQRQFFPEVFERSRFSRPVFYKSLDSALFNTLITHIGHRPKRPGGRLLLQGLLGLMYSILSSRLKKYVLDYAPDCLIATQMYPNALLARSIEKGIITQPVIGVLTDYGVHGVWVRNTTHRYCVSHAAAADSLRRQGVPAHRIRITGIPLTPAYASLPTQQEARQSLGLSSRPTVLITGGQCSIGVTESVKELLRDPTHQYQVLVTAGSGADDLKALQALTAEYQDRFRLYGWMDDISTLICAADVVVGKPGGLTLSESLACGKPFIATCCLGGQEKHNVHFLEENSAGLLVEPHQLSAQLGELFRDKPRLQFMKANAQRLGRPNAANAVVDEIVRVMEVRSIPYLQQVGIR